jgi:hypothetical protein
MMPSEVVRALREVLPPSADIGKIKMTLAEGGAVLDLNMKIADKLAERDSIPGMVVEIITALPELEREREDFGGGESSDHISTKTLLSHDGSPVFGPQGGILTLSAFTRQMHHTVLTGICCLVTSTRLKKT